LFKGVSEFSSLESDFTRKNCKSKRKDTMHSLIANDIKKIFSIIDEN